VVFLDSNIPMYLVGADHPNKGAAARLLRRVIDENRRLVTDAEVFQEILHRYTSLNRRDAIEPAFDVLQRLVDDVLSIQHVDVVDAKNRLRGGAQLSARDALHLAVMFRHGISEILTFDRGFDGMTDVTRIAER
jgi:hypothetical protein